MIVPILNGMRHMGAQHPGPAADSGCRADRKRASELSGAGFPVVISDDIPAAMWYKWAFIAAAGALTCLLRGAGGQIMAAAGDDVAPP
jgi:2-dehydropantoate 2-reductase